MSRHPTVPRDDRAHPNVVVRHRSPNQSERASVPLCLIILHDTESANIPGDADLSGLGDWFGNPSAEVSAHVATDADGDSGRYVADASKAWHCAGFNSYSLGIEQIGFASQTRSQWRHTWKQLRETARWIAYWSIKHGIPIRRAQINGSTVARSGVARHMDLGIVGGGHSDPGAAYPFNRVLWLARAYKALRLARRH